MKKRLCSVLLAIVLVVGLVGAVPAHAAKTPEQFRAAEPELFAGSEPADGAAAMTASAFRSLADFVRAKGHADGDSWVAGGKAPLDNTDLDVGFTIEYNSKYDVILLNSWIVNNGKPDPLTGVLCLTNAAEAPLEEVLIADETGGVVGRALITCDHKPGDLIYFSEYNGESADADTFVRYNSMLCTALTAFLHAALAEVGCTLEDIGLVAAARSIGVNNQTPFNDVRTTDYFYAPVLWALQRSVTNGTSPTRFSPNATCTRAQVVTFLWRAAGSPAPKASRSPFRDVDVSEWYGKAVLWAVEQGITNGTSSTAFSPDQGCTRGQVVTFLQRYLNGKVSGVGNPFADVPTDAYYYNAVLWAVSKNITNGVDAAHFGPEMTCTRGQIVTFLYRAAA